MGAKLEEQLRVKIADFIALSPSNRLRGAKSGRIYDEPLVGFARGDDPIFKQYKTIIGGFHLTPLEYLEKLAKEENKQFAPAKESTSVVSWILPFSEAVKGSNRRQTRYPSEEWAQGRYYGELFNDELRRHVTRFLEKEGHLAGAPVLSKHFYEKRLDTVGYASTWSERHIAYAAGLGTFSLSDGLITPKGKAMRCGSVVVNAELKHTKRKTTGIRDNCLHYTKKICKRCADRCPAGAITERGHDKDKCRSYASVKMNEYAKTHYGLDTYGCGLCQTNVPCESGIPGETNLQCLNKENGSVRG